MIKKICFFILLSGLMACEDKLELTDPNNTGDAIALSNDKNVKTTLNGAYDALSAGALFGGNTLRNSELLAAGEDVVFSGTFNDVADIYRKQIIALNADAAALWTSGYRVINIANNVLSALSVVNEADRDQVEGEALFLRGIVLFELVKFFAQPYSAGNTNTNLGVPIMLVEDRNSTALVPRRTVQEVYDQIISDLTTAEGKLPEGPRPGKATKEAAAAFLSRVYLQMGNYAEARDAANRVIQSGIYSLLNNYASCFNGGTTPEDIFDIPVSTVDGVNNMHTFYASTSNGGRGDVEIQSAHLLKYEAGDERLALFYIDTGTGETRTGKWVNQFGNVKIVRLAEMYLTRAECNFRLSTNVGADPLDDVNEIRDRVGLASLTGPLTLSDILRERELELAHEGHRLHDVKRLMQDVIEGAIIYPFNDPRMVFPIPQREINVNPNLVQNNGY
ncbi:MAG: membrane protein [Cyclobacteriaceae bacterium]|nr:MAG: membrane protein [Cyclobacteriaceae bacterium]